MKQTLYAEEGGSGGSEEEGWSNGSEAEAREILRARILRDEAAKTAGFEAAEAEVADPLPAEAHAQFTTAGINEGGAVIQHGQPSVGIEGGADVSGGELERRRKGKGIMEAAFKEGNVTGRVLRASSYNSGSDSWDPIKASNQMQKEGSSFSSKDADSRAQPAGQQVRDKALINQHPTNEDMDLGGEGGGGINVAKRRAEKNTENETEKEGGGNHQAKVKTEAVETKGGKEGGREEDTSVPRGDKEVIVISDDSEEGAKKRKVGVPTGSRGTSASVPPGYQRMHGARSSVKGGAASPFGKLQRGGFRFLKRSSSGASSGARTKTTEMGKKTKPISALPDKAIEELATNVGVAQPLSEEQIAILKSLEEERATT